MDSHYTLENEIHDFYIAYLVLLSLQNVYVFSTCVLVDTSDS